MDLKGLHHIAIICSDYAKSLDFYTRILGFNVIGEHYRADRQSYKTDLAMHGEYLIELFSFPTPPPRLSYPEACGLRHLAFCVSDLEQAIAHLSAHGIAHQPVRTDEYTGRRFLFFADPDGLPIELYEIP
ncbi:MAG: VOC family protein [Alloprevotella sp.]|nr:VOC family protein [Alloprevotella sp.]